MFVFNGTTWSRGPSLPIAVNHPGAAAIKGDVYVAGGFTPSGATDRRLRTRRRPTDLARARTDAPRTRRARASRVDGRLYTIGGRDGDADRRARGLRPGRGTWSTSRHARAAHHVAGYVDGALACVAGGRTPVSSAAVDCFDPPTHVAARRRATDATSGAAAGSSTARRSSRAANPSRAHLSASCRSCATVLDQHPDARAPPRRRIRDLPRPALPAAARPRPASTPSPRARRSGS